MHFSGKKNLSLRESDTGKCAAGIAAFKAAGVDGESIGSKLVWIGQKIVSGVVQITDLDPGSGPYREDEGACGKSQTWIPRPFDNCLTTFDDCLTALYNQRSL